MEIENFDILELDSNFITNSLFDKYFEHRMSVLTELYPDYVKPDINKFRDNWVMESSNYVTKRYGVIINNDFVGNMRLEIPQQNLKPSNDTTKIGHFEVIVKDEYRRKGFGKYLLKYIANVARKSSLEQIECICNQTSGKIFCKSFNGKIVADISESSLDLSKIDWEFFQTQILSSLLEELNISLESYIMLPEIYKSEYYKLTYLFLKETCFFNSEPILSEDKYNRYWDQYFNNYKNSGLEFVIIFAKNQKGEIIGFSDAQAYKNNPLLVTHGMTGVLTQYRGKGLGLMLKYALICHIRESFPSVIKITTRNDLENKWIVSINDKLGYVKNNLIQTFRFDIDKLWTLFNNQNLS